MLHTFFFALSFLTDYHDVADALRDGLMLGLINACLVYVGVAWRSFLGRMPAGNPGSSPRSRVEQLTSSKLRRPPRST
ncbi:MAG: hypothetical protein WA736_05045 [Candidatus Acidiferrum sp.]